MAICGVFVKLEGPGVDLNLVVESLVRRCLAGRGAAGTPTEFAGKAAEVLTTELEAK